MKLSPHFTLAELCKSQTALRFNIDNTATETHIKNLKYLCETILEPIREKYGPFTPTSGYRSKALNEQIGGSQKSQHSLGQAADLEIAGIPNPELAKFFLSNPNNGWVHVSTKPDGCRKSCMAYDGKDYTYLTL
jgi:zinc D-Ala-D-Ala carboxypeptidase